MGKFYIRFSLFVLVFFALSTTLKAQSCEVFREDFNGSTTFEEILIPYGTASQTCIFAYSAVYQNNGSEHYLTTTSFMESMLKKTGLNLPSGTYEITLKWRTSTESGPVTQCNATHYDDRFGASCDLPNRLMVINTTLLYEKPGLSVNFNSAPVIYYTGKIDSILLPVIGSCSVNPFYTYYDYLVIKSVSVLPKVNFTYTVQDSVVSFTDSTINAGVDTPLWNFGDGTTSTDLNPQHTYPFIDSVYTVCLTRKNSCGSYFICKDVQIEAPDDTIMSINEQSLNTIRMYPNPAKDRLYLESAASAILDIYTIWGKRVAQIHIPQGYSVIDISPYQKGVYLVRTDKGATSRLMLLD